MRCSMTTLHIMQAVRSQRESSQQMYTGCCLLKDQQGQVMLQFRSHLRSGRQPHRRRRISGYGQHLAIRPAPMAPGAARCLDIPGQPRSSKNFSLALKSCQSGARTLIRMRVANCWVVSGVKEGVLMHQRGDVVQTRRFSTARLGTNLGRSV